MSAQSASDANHFLAEIRLPGTDRTYEIRDVLRGMGLRWDPATHAWHGRLLAAQRALLERRYGLAAKVVVPIEAFEPSQVARTLPPVRPWPPSGPRGPPRDYSRTRFESRLAFLGADEGDIEDTEELATPTRQFSLLEVTSGLPDDSRATDEKQAECRLRDLRGRVKAARAAISATPGVEEILRRDWLKAARFYARFGVAEATFRHGAPRIAVGNIGRLEDRLRGCLMGRVTVTSPDD